MTPVKLLMTSAGSYHKSRAYVPYGTSPRIISHEPTYLPLRASQVPQRDHQGGLQPAAVHRLGQASGHPARRCPSGASQPHRCKQRRHCPRWAKCKEKLKKQPQNLAIANYFGNFASQIVLWCNGSTTGFGSVCGGSNPPRTTCMKRRISRDSDASAIIDSDAALQSGIMVIFSDFRVWPSVPIVRNFAP